MEQFNNNSNDGKGKPAPERPHSKDLLHIGKNVRDPLLIRKKKPYKMPPSSVLSQVKSFLPKMQEANSRLEEQLKVTPPEDLDIENVADCEHEVIEMNLALFAEEDSSSGDEENDDSDGMCDGGSDANSEDEAFDKFGEVTAANMKLPNASTKSKRTMIEDLSGGTEVKGHDLKSETGLDSSEGTATSTSNIRDVTHRRKEDEIVKERP